MELKSSLRVFEFAALLAAAGVAHAADTDVAGLDTVTPDIAFSSSASGQRADTFADMHGFSLLTSDDGSLKRRLTPDDGVAPLSDLAPRVFSSLTNTLVGSTYGALSKTSLHAGLASADDDTQGAEPDRNNIVLPLAFTPSNNGKAGLAAAMSEPQGYAMFLAGLGIMGMVVRRRSRSF